MSKIKILKNYINDFFIIFDRILKDYEPCTLKGLFNDNLEYKSHEGRMQISLGEVNTIKVSKQEKNRKINETIKFEYDEIITTEKITTNNYKEEVIRTYSENELISLDSFLRIIKDDQNEVMIKIHIDKDKVLVNSRDITPLYKNYRNDIEAKYLSLKGNYLRSKNPEHIYASNTEKQVKTRRQIILEEQIRTYIKEEFDYHAPLQNKNLDELTRILNMLVKRREYQEPKIKQYRKDK